MRVDLSCQTLNLIEGNKLQISSQTGSPLTTVGLNPLFIKEKLPGSAEVESSHLPSEPWIEVTLLTTDSTTSKTYLISISKLQSAIDREELERGERVVTATRGGHGEALTQLLASGPISQRHQGQAVRIAAIYGHAQILSALLAHGATISEHYRGEAVKGAAATHGRTEIVAQLLTRGATILAVDRGEAVASAASAGYTDILTQLLANGPISEEARGQAVRYAASAGHTEIVTLLRV